VFQWLETLRFCALGESGPFVEAGNTRLGGSLPVNPTAGNVGRRHGADFCIETVRQLRGECGERQVADAEVGLGQRGRTVLRRCAHDQGPVT
jgi:acetyl-CoA acetyltransferase